MPDAAGRLRERADAAQPIDRAAQPLDGLGLRHGARSSLRRKPQIARQVEFAGSKRLMVSAAAQVVKMEMAQLMPVFQHERFRAIARRGVVADVQRQPEAVAFQQHGERFKLERQPAAAVFDAEPRAGGPRFALVQRPKRPQPVPIHLPISLEQIDPPVRQREVDACGQVHIEDRRRQRRRDADGAAQRLQPCLRHGGIEVEGVEILVQMDCIIHAVTLREPLQPFYVDRVGLVLRQIHIQLEEAQAERCAKPDAVLGVGQLEQRRHAEIDSMHRQFSFSNGLERSR